MDWLTFIASVVGAAAWPATVVTIFFLLRGPIAGLIPLLQKLKYKDLELDFSRQLEKAEDEAAAIALPLAPSLPKALPPERGIGSREGQITELAKISTRAAIVEAWRGVEESVFTAAQRRGLARPGSTVRSFGHLIRELRSGGDVDPAALGLLEDLRGLRNQAAHASGFSVTEEAALDYARLVEQLIAYFEGWGNSAPDGG